MKYTALLSLLALASLAYGETSTSQIQPFLQSLLEKHIVAGVVTWVANKDKVLDVEAAGYTSLANKTLMHKDALFWIASMSKSFTGTALMMLADEGKVSLDDPVEKFLPEFKGQQVKNADGTLHPPKHPITVREIMDHTSGLVLANDKALKQTQSLQENVAAIAAMPLRQEPGTKYQYNNVGINTGARIIEVLSGMSYAVFMQKRLFDPLGMQDTTFWPNEEQASRLAHTARFTADKTGLEEIKQDKDAEQRIIDKWSEGVHVPRTITADMGAAVAFNYAKHYGEPAGGFYSTAHDVGTFCRMLLNGGTLEGKRYLSAQAVKQMSAVQTGDVPVSPQEAYGVGWSVKIRDEDGPSVGSFGHRGARRTAMWIDPTNELVMVILVERFDMTGEEQKVMYGGFMKAAVAAYGKSKP
jgi:CubicO group peptidase (beta-lactamase class C family)